MKADNYWNGEMDSSEVLDWLVERISLLTMQLDKIERNQSEMREQLASVSSNCEAKHEEKDFSVDAALQKKMGLGCPGKDKPVNNEYGYKMGDWLEIRNTGEIVLAGRCTKCFVWCRPKGKRYWIKKHNTSVKACDGEKNKASTKNK